MMPLKVFKIRDFEGNLSDLNSRPFAQNPAYLRKLRESWKTVFKFWLPVARSIGKPVSHPFLVRGATLQPLEPSTSRPIRKLTGISSNEFVMRPELYRKTDPIETLLPVLKKKLFYNGVINFFYLKA
ncbi:hypothetical protein TNCT_369991 [Trichonephila clavata]|uniref:Uncharacterized protein n=1 Tax=Trichonephila clavata TaxID=2740835 RepID=A0A8X6J0C8_TRICU|nr:hypothetical protein TNCT_369991 [Trichonephila clavata]